MESGKTWYACGTTLQRTGQAKESSNCNAAGDPKFPEEANLEVNKISGGSIQK